MGSASSAQEEAIIETVAAIDVVADSDAISIQDFVPLLGSGQLTTHITRFKSVVDGKRRCHCHVCGHQFDSAAELRLDDVKCPNCSHATLLAEVR